MKRDMDLIRRLMLAVESQPPSAHPMGSDLVQPGDDPALVAEHLHLLIDAGYLDGSKDQTLSGPRKPGHVLVTGISWEGHEFIDVTRNETVWAKTKEALAKVGGGASLSIVKEIAAGVTRALLGL